MKKTMVLAASALVLILAGCPQPGDGDNGGVTSVPPISITVGGIPGHDGGFGAMGLRNAQGVLVAASNPVAIIGDSAAMALLNVQNGTPFNTEGPFTLELVVSETESGDAVWFGDIASRPIAGGNNDIPFAYFTPWEENPPLVEGTEYRIPPGDDPEDQLGWLQRNARSGSQYLIGIDDGETEFAPQILDMFGRSDVTVIIRGNSTPIIRLSEPGHLFRIGSGVTLMLESVTLQGRDDNTLSLVYVGTGGTLIMETGSRITGNTRNPGAGAGVIIGDGGRFYMNAGEISDNHSRNTDWTGGGGVNIWSGGTFYMNGGVITGNTADRLPNPEGGIGTNGGGVRTYGTFVMNNGTISGNTARLGAGVGIGMDGTFTMNNGTIVDNATHAEGWSDGGGVYIGGGRTFTMNGGTISGNTSGSGGGVRVGSNSTFVMNDGTISGNTARSVGGGVRSDSDGTFVMYDGTIYDNEARYGGGVQTYGTFVMHDGSIHENNATHSGGGVHVDYGGLFTLYGGILSGNRAEGYYHWNAGGGVAVNCGDGNSGTFRMQGGVISGNYASNAGGGVFVGGWYGHYNPVSGTFHISDGIIHGNNAAGDLGNTAQRGAALYVQDSGYHIATAQRGTFSNGAFTPAANGGLTSANNTVHVVGGNLQ